jgi:Domain of unknown function (DUF1906)
MGDRPAWREQGFRVSYHTQCGCDVIAFGGMRMRRAATIMLIIGWTAAGVAAGGAPASAADGATAAHRAAASPRALAESTKVIRFAGYTLDVPAAWPVYRLARDPARCVRFDRHAVYLGRPGPSQQCPAHLVGRVATLTIEATGHPAGNAPRRPAVAWDRADHLVQALLPRGAATVTATYGTGPGEVSRILGTARWAGAGRSVTAAPARPPGRELARHRARRHHRHHRRRHPCHYRCCHHRLCHPRWIRMPVKGLDTCTAPSLRAMRAWYRAFKAAAIYLGGPEAACGWGNLSPGWIRATVRTGWAVIPSYVGPQAPCTRFTVRIRPGHAEQQGRASADDAIRLARELGMHRGAVIYDDMEGFRPHHGRCRSPVLAFLDGWTRELHARGYRSGVYSSASAAARDLGRYSRVYGHRIAKPNSLWFALWDGHRNLRGTPYVRNSWWRGHRIKQYKGGHRRRIGGAWLSFDADLVDGAVYR